MLNGVTSNMCLKAFLGLLSRTDLSSTDKSELLSLLSHPPSDSAHFTWQFLDHDYFSRSDPAAGGGLKS